MSKIKLAFWSSIFVYTLSVLLISFTNWTPPAQAQFYCRFWPKACQNRGRVLKGKGGTRRGSCASTAENLIALVPENVQEDEQELKVELTTAQAYPTFWFYLPSYPSTKEARFILLDANKHPVLKEPIRIELPETPGIAEFTLPNTEKSLQVGKRYTWYFEVVCDRRNPDRNPIVRGQIERIEPIEQNPQQENQLPGYFVSANNGVVWYDTLTQLARNRNLYSKDWIDLLGSEIPTSVAQEPIVLQPMNVISR
jgi:hypothetical protein